MKKILVSGCLYGWIVRYDAKYIPCTDERFLKWKEEGRLIPVCPEVLGGLSTPRHPCERVGDRVLNSIGEDVTKEFEKGAIESVCLAKEQNIVCAIMKSGSPTCGSKMIYDGTFSGGKIPGQGVAVEQLREAGFTVFDEDDLDLVEQLLAE